MGIDIKKLRNDRIVLREFRKSEVWEGSDAQQIAKIAQHPEFRGFYAFPPKGLPEKKFRDAMMVLVATWVELSKTHEITHKRENYKLAITRPGEPKIIIGYIALDEINATGKKYRDIGCFINPDFQFLGYATEASQIVLKAFFENTKYKEIYITYHPDNIASKRVAEKLGYKILEGNYTLTVNGNEEPREKCVLTRKAFFDNLPPGIP